MKLEKINRDNVEIGDVTKNYFLNYILVPEQLHYMKRLKNKFNNDLFATFLRERREK